MAGVRHLLTTELRRVRAVAGLTQQDVATALEWSLSKFVRIENGTVGISVVDLHALLRLYNEGYSFGFLLTHYGLVG